MKEKQGDNTTNTGMTALKINFPWGIPGLDYKEYMLSPLAEESPFIVMESVENPEVGLLLVSPFGAFSDYEFDLGDEVADQLEIKDQCQVAVLCTVNTSRGIDSATVNLLAPIVINKTNLLGKQVVLNEKKYSLRAPLTFNRSKK